jgi:hypothetical protein
MHVARPIVTNGIPSGLILTSLSQEGSFLSPQDDQNRRQKFLFGEAAAVAVAGLATNKSQLDGERSHTSTGGR